MPVLSLHSPLGDITLFEEDGSIVALEWGWSSYQESSPILDKAKQQLDDYFDGKRTTFDLPLAPNGTDFQKRVWDKMLTIQSGDTLTYKEISDALKSAPRAVGGACGKNPIPIIIPCHRVLASNGGFGGYSGDGGIDTKKQLLTLEGAL